MFKIRKSYLFLLVAVLMMAFASPAFAQNGSQAATLTFDEDATTADVTESIGITPAGNIFFTVSADLPNASIRFGRDFSVRWFADTDFDLSGPYIGAEQVSTNVAVGPTSSGSFEVRGSFATGVVVVYLNGGNGGDNGNGNGGSSSSNNGGNTNTSTGTTTVRVINPIGDGGIVSVGSGEIAVVSVWCNGSAPRGEQHETVYLIDDGTSADLHSGCNGSAWIYLRSNFEAARSEAAAHATRISAPFNPDPANTWGLFFSN